MVYYKCETCDYIDYVSDECQKCGGEMETITMDDEENLEPEDNFDKEYSHD